MHWHPAARDFADMIRLDPAIVESAARNPAVVSDDPHGLEVGYPVKRHRRGDLEVVVGFQDAAQPAILFVRQHIPNQRNRGQGDGATSGKGSGAGSSLPTSLRELRRRICAAGYKIVPGRRHDKVVTSAGDVLVTLPSTPSDHRSVPNTWRKFCQRHDLHQAGLWPPAEAPVADELRA